MFRARRCAESTCWLVQLHVKGLLEGLVVGGVVVVVGGRAQHAPRRPLPYNTRRYKSVLVLL